MDEPTPRFLVDAMLGHLARDLRLLGYDVAYDPEEDDDALLVHARAEERVLVTKDRRLAERARERGVLLTAATPADELPELVAAMGLAPEASRFLTRCTKCGGRLERVPSRGLELPDGVAERHERVSRCGACAHVYWDGTHVEAIRRRLARYVRGS